MSFIELQNLYQLFSGAVCMESCHELVRRFIGQSLYVLPAPHLLQTEFPIRVVLLKHGCVAYYVRFIFLFSCNVCVSLVLVSWRGVAEMAPQHTSGSCFTG